MVTTPLVVNVCKSGRYS